MIYLLSFVLCFTTWGEESLETIRVSHGGISNSLVDFVPNVTVLQSKDLKKRREINLGDTLKNEAGIQSSSFGPNAGRPIIRGLDGDRIRILQNGLGVLDASSASVDHAVPIDTLIIDSIEVVRGPMSLLYGSSAVGGVVNVNTNRIHNTYEEGTIREFQVQGDSAQNALSSSARLDHGAKNWMFHVDAGYRNANDLRIPGKQKSERLNAPGKFEAKNKLPNSGSVQKTAAVGAARIFDRGYFGMSYYFFDNFYGTVADEDVDIKMKQNRIELHTEYQLRGDVFKSIRLKTAQSDYLHKEFESGEVGTTFSNEGNETRLEISSEASGFKGITGFQGQKFNFKAVGDEAFLPPTQNQLISAFTLQELTVNQNIFSVGGRLENAVIENKVSGGKERDFNGVNGSLGYRRLFSQTHTGLISFSYTERIPNYQELFAEGFHVASGTYELGDENLHKEKAFALDTGLKYHSDSTTASLSVYAQQFKDYIALINTGKPSPELGIDISSFQQVDAIFYGFEFDGKKRLEQSPLSIITKADLVRGKNKDNGKNLPRISPPRITLGLEWVNKRWTLDVEEQYNFEQTKTAPNETRTNAFILLNAGVAYDLIKGNAKWSFFTRLKNILNEEARLHTSTLKDIAPLAGRSVVAGVQYIY